MTTKIMTREIDRIVCLTDADASAELARLRDAERRAYAEYCHPPAPPVPAPGSPQTVGHGSFVCSLNTGGVQDRWYAARAARERFDRVRSETRGTGRPSAWRREIRGDVAAYTLSIDCLCHTVEVVHHGVDLTEAASPAAAIAAVRGALGYAHA